MRILISIPCLLIGGTEVQTLQLVRALVGGGHRVTTVCYFERTESMVQQYEAAGSEVVMLSPDGSRPKGVARTVRFLWKGLRRAVKAVKPDVVHVQYMAPGALPIFIYKLLGAKNIIATLHTAADIYPNLRLIHFLQRHVVRAFLCITEIAERSFFGSSELFSGKSIVGKRNHFTIHNALPPHIPLRSKPRDFSEGKPITIGVVSRLERIKGMDLVLPAFLQLAANTEREVRLLVVGDGSLRQQMEEGAKASPFADRITFMGRQAPDELPAAYDAIDVLWMPSRSEGFGLSALEGMARGCVVVASDVGGLPEVIGKDGTSGITVASGNVTALADVSCGLLQDLTLIRSMSACAIKRAETFNFERYALLHNRLYEGL